MKLKKLVRSLMVPKSVIRTRAKAAAEKARLTAHYPGPQDCYIFTVKSRLGTESFCGGYNDLGDVVQAYRAVLDEFGISSEVDKRID